MNKKGFAPIILFGIIALIAFGSAGGYFIVKKREGGPVACTQDAKICPDGSAVGRVGPKCEFAACPSPSPSPKPTPETSPIAGGCIVTGCSGQICAAEEVITTCEFRPEYACYKTARCERQLDGKCGWTMTNELAACLELAKTGRQPITPNASVPLSSPSPKPSPSPSPSPSPMTMVHEVTVAGDDFGLYPATITVPRNSTVRLTFRVRSENVYYGGLDFRSSKFSTPGVPPGGTYTVEFIADNTFSYSSYWPASGVKKADGTVVVQ